MSIAESPVDTTLAVGGGTRTRTAAFPPWPAFDDADAAAAARVLLSGHVNYWTGSEGRSFEEEFAAVAGATYGVAVSNGTVAIEIALRALGVGTGDEVIVPAATFIATASAVAMVGARPVVVDVDVDTQALTAETVRPALTERTAAVVVVHVGGFPADLAPLAALLDERGIPLVEDCAQAHGAAREGRPVGSTGAVAAWSFCQDKIMTTGGEGGAITTSDEHLWRRCWELKDHGKNHTEVHTPPAQPGFRWLHDSFGTNARMTEMQAAVGRVQLGRLPGYVERRRDNAARLRDGLGDLPLLRLPSVPETVHHSYYRFYAHIREEHLRPGWNRDRVVAAIAAEGVPCLSGGCTEIYRERAFDLHSRPAERLPVASWLGEHSLVLLTHPTAGPSDIEDVVRAVRKVAAEVTA